MPDLTIPRFWRAVLRVMRGAIYGAILLSGIGGVVWPIQSPVGAFGTALLAWCLAMSGVGSAFAIIGVITDRWRVESISSWPIAAGVLGYATVVWGLVLDGQEGRFLQACLFTGLFIALAYRALELAAHAAMLRQLHERATGPLRTQE